MATAGTVLLWTVFALLVITGLGLNALGLFGNWVILGALVIVWVATGFIHFGWIGFAAFFMLAVLGELLEAGLAAAGAQRFGGTKGTMVATIVGAIGGGVLGTPMLPVIGTLLGAIAGAFVAAVLYEFIQSEKPIGQALYTGFGAAAGKVGGIAAKFGVGLLMLLAAWLTRGHPVPALE